MLRLQGPLDKPGLFITGTDTNVGKTVVTCAIAHALRQQRRGVRLALCKPLATGAKLQRAGLTSEDARALAAFADPQQPIEHVCPIHLRPPMAPAMAAEVEREKVDWQALAHTLTTLNARHDGLLIEGVGGAMVPLDPAFARYTVRDLAKAIGYPVIVVCRPGLGTLSHTAMTVQVLQDAGCRVVGLVINGSDNDPDARANDPSLPLNPRWLERVTGIKVLANFPKARPNSIDLPNHKLDPAIQNAALQTDWAPLMEPGTRK